MDLLKGKEIMVWTFMGITRMYQTLRDYGAASASMCPHNKSREFPATMHTLTLSCTP
ncbi:MAG: hypothetical protein LUF91_07170 [Oscillospiraceae bacterium]|nr:hypothetical protein [Oscillospiraceae bacterium]